MKHSRLFVWKNQPTARLHVVGLEDRKNDVIFCGAEAQQHVVFFPGDVQVSLKQSCCYFTFFACISRCRTLKLTRKLYDLALGDAK